jgi:hypothetical protein
LEASVLLAVAGGADLGGSGLLVFNFGEGESSIEGKLRRIKRYGGGGCCGGAWWRWTRKNGKERKRFG